jgi:hypothetical protein
MKKLVWIIGYARSEIAAAFHVDCPVYVHIDCLDKVQLRPMLS